MGRQVNFFMLPDDENRFVQSVAQMNFVKFIKQQSEKYIEEIVLEGPSKDHEPILLWDSRQTITPEQVSYREDCFYAEDYTTLIHTGVFKYHIDIDQAPVIEFRRSFIRNDNVLVPGRIWAEMSRFVNGYAETKGDDFIALYDSLAKLIKKKSKHYQNTYEYFCSSANQWFVDGGSVFLSSRYGITLYEDFKK